MCMNILASTELGQISERQSELNSEEEVPIFEDEASERYNQCATHTLPDFSVR